MTLNRTFKELKLSKPGQIGMDNLTLNRTFKELKLIKGCFYFGKFKESLNRTFKELKLGIPSRLPTVWRPLNRTFKELKQHGNVCKRWLCRLLIAPLRN